MSRSGAARASDARNPQPACAAGGCCRPPFTVSIDPADSELAQGFKALGDTVRLTLLSLIAAAGDGVCVCDLTTGFDLSGPTISHHLKVLHDAGLVERERRGTWVYYRPRRAQVRRLARLLDSTADAAPIAHGSGPHPADSI